MTTATGVITGVSVAHQRAGLDDIEAAGVDDGAGVVRSLVADGAVREAFALGTCNRAEAYVVTEDAAAGREALSHVVAGVPEGSVRWLGHEESLEHLLRVACGLESLVVGEDQILGQVRDAYNAADAAGGLGAVLEEAVRKAIHVGERARSETRINEGAVSMGSAAARLADAELDGLDGVTALVIGAGEMGSLAARSLAARVDRLVVANRTRSRAEHVVAALSEEVGVDAEAAGLDELEDVLERAELVVAATGSDDPVIDRTTLAAAGETVVLDLARPRDVAAAAAELASVSLRDLEDIEAVTDATEARRAAAAEEVAAMIDAELERLLAQFKRKRADEVIAAMYEGAEQVKERELSTAISQLEAGGGLTGDQREAVESLADALVGQLLAAPTKSLREAAEEDDWETINTALRLFDPEFETVEVDDGMPDELEGMSPEDIPPGMRDRIPDPVLERIED
jgi:glutamyl-tRNA reductase